MRFDVVWGAAPHNWFRIRLFNVHETAEGTFFSPAGFMNLNGQLANERDRLAETSGGEAMSRLAISWGHEPLV